MERLHKEIKVENSRSIETYQDDRLAIEIHFSSEEHAKTFRNLASESKRRRIACLVAADGDMMAAADMSGYSRGNFAKRLGEIFRQDFNSSRKEVIQLKSRQGIRKSVSHSVTASDLMTMIEKQEYRCALSGIALTTDSAVLDHIIPVSDGGSNEIGNLQWVDKRVNSMKANMSQDDFIGMCAKVTAWNR